MTVPAIEEFERLLQRAEPEIDLGRAALVLARLEYPDLATEPYLQQLAGFAESAAARLGQQLDPRGGLETLNQYLFEELSFHGNERDYYDPRNSFLNDVLERRTGIPITLSVVYMEVARRLGLPVFGVGLPGHFVVKFDDRQREIFIDPFHGGRLLDRPGCQTLMDQLHGGRVRLRDLDFAAVEKRHIVLRMLNNLRGIYLHSRQYRKALQVLEMILVITPGSAEEIKQRGWLHYELGQYCKSKADLGAYLEQCPEASDAEQIRTWLEAIQRTTAGMN